MEIAERFWTKVSKSGPLPSPYLGQCWLWTSPPRDGGYGQFYVRTGLVVRAHRFAYEQFHGSIPEGLTLDHLCRNTLCVNPVHLEAVTQRENTLRGNGPAAKHARKTHCKRGHPYNESNTYFYPDGRRGCRVCRRAARLPSEPSPTTNEAATTCTALHSCGGGT
ncbi:MAG TPA: HNH endonuclease signature motif containing protein [Terriglobia bacterium]|nr:HNH endonuclease signature motif containing protein [Terriglobia bacterium]